MSSEIRTNSLKSRAGLSTVTLTDSGPMFSGITTFVDNSGFNLGTGSSIFSPATNTLTFGTNLNERLRIDSNGLIQAKTRSAEVRRMILSGSPSNSAFNIEAHDGETGTSSGDLQGKLGLFYNDGSTLTNTANISFFRGSGAPDGAMAFVTNQTERLRIDSSGRLLLNTTTTYVSNQMMIVKGSSPSAGGNRPYDGQLAIEGSEENGAINTGGVLAFIGHSGAGSRGFGSIRCLKEDGISGNYGSYMSFETRVNGSAPAEKFRITSGGCFFGNNIGIGTDNRWKIRPNTNYTELAFEYSTNTALADTNIKMALKSDSVDVLSDFAIKSSLAKMSMIDTDGGDYFQLRNDGGTFKIRNSTDGRDDISITNNALTFGGVAKITDNNSIFFGNDNDIEMRHNATSSQNQIIGINHDFLLQSHGTIYMQCFQSGNSTNGNVLTANYNAGTALYYQNGERLVTTNAGCKISNNLSFNNWLNISKSGTYAPATVGHTASNHEGIFWHSGSNYSIFRTSGSWGGPNYQQLRIDWPTGIRFDGGSSYGLSGARFNCHALPYADNNFDLGLSNRRWDDVYATNTSIVSSSDETLKDEITSLTAAEMKAAKRLSALFKKFKWKSAVAEKGSAARTHTGIIAQHVKTAMEAEGLDPTIYAFFCFDEWYENDKKEVITLDQLKDDIPDPLDSSKTLTPPSTEGYTKVSRYSIRYTELLSFIAAYNNQRFADLESLVQESITKIETFEQDNIALRARVTNLEDK